MRKPILISAISVAVLGTGATAFFMANQAKPEPRPKADTSTVQPATPVEAPQPVDVTESAPAPALVPEPTVTNPPVQTSTPVATEESQQLPNRYAREMEVTGIKPEDFDTVCKLLFKGDCAPTGEDRPISNAIELRLHIGMIDAYHKYGGWKEALAVYEDQGSW